MLIGIDASRANVHNKTGTEWYAYFLIEEFKKIADPHDRFILYSKETLEGALAKLPVNFSSRVLKWPFGFLWTQFRLAFEMLIHKPDVLFVPAHTVPVICPTRTITTLHDIGFERFSSLYSKQFIGPKNLIARWLLYILVRIVTFGRYGTSELDYHRWSARLALRKASKIITVSKFSKNEIINRFKVHSNKIVAIPNAYHPDFRKIKDHDAIERTMIKYNIKFPFFLSVGRLEEKKNTLRLVQAFELYINDTHDQKSKLVLIGSQGFGYEKIKKYIEAHTLANRVIMPGWIPNSDLIHFMNKATFFLFPTLYEGFGMPVLEAMASGTPVITSRIESIQEIAGDGAYLVDPHNSKEIAKAMAHLINNDDYRFELIQKGLKQAHQFSWNSTALQTLAVIKSA